MQEGWICPRCNTVNAPWKSKCDCGQKEVSYPHYPQYPVYPHYPYWSPYSIPTDPSEPYKITSEFNYGGVVTC